MHGSQRIPCILELSKNGTVRLYRKKDQIVFFEAPARSITYSAANIVKSRLRLSAQQKVVRLGVGSINSQQSSASNKGSRSVMDVWTSALNAHGAQEDPSQPERKIDQIGVLAAIFSLVMLLLVIGLVVMMRL